MHLPAQYSMRKKCMFASVHTEELVNLCVVRCNRASVCECMYDLSFVLYCFCVFKECDSISTVV